jgi:structural maintenance of chromosome 4
MRRADEQESCTAQLAQEQEANAHHLAEIDSLQKEYDEKLAAFQEVKQFVDQLVKDSKKYEKEEVGLSEKKKHLNAKAKKFKKSVTDVSFVGRLWAEGNSSREGRTRP